LRRDFFFNFDGKVSKLSQLRIRDNYLHFYLKVIEPLKPNIQKGGKKIMSLSEIKNFSSFMGYQFENVLLYNRKMIHEKMGISAAQIISSSPYKQQADRKVIKEVQEKCLRIKLPKRCAAKPVLVHLDEILASDKDEIHEYFYKIISFADLVTH